jgi:DNA-binding Xre family transcriptional regulator
MKREEMAMYRIKVKEVAQRKGISQRQLFLRSGVDIRTVRKIFQHPDAVITVETLAKLAKVLEVDVSELIESIPDKPPDTPSTE